MNSETRIDQSVLLPGRQGSRQVHRLSAHLLTCWRPPLSPHGAPSPGALQPRAFGVSLGDNWGQSSSLRWAAREPDPSP